MNTELSGYAQLHGGFNYNSTPLSPPGKQVIIHEKLTVGVNLASQGVKGWYLDPSMNHYQCHHIYATKKKENENQIVLNFPYIILHSPTILSQKMSSSAHELAHALKNPAPQAAFSNINDYQMITIEQFSQKISKVADNVLV